MKSKMKIKEKVVGSIVCLSMIFYVSSCAGDGFDDETFSGGVTNMQLDSPKASDVEFMKLPGTTNVKVTWPVIMGAGGYQFSLYIVDDPTNPVAVVKDSIIDGASVVCPYVEDTNYKAEITTLGNEKLNNTTSISPAEVAWSTLVPATNIPGGTDLTEYFINNPINKGKDVEVAYELEAGGTYTISGDINFGVNNVQLRGNKVDHAKVTFTGAGSIVTCGGGLALKFIDFDCDVVTGGAFLKFGDVPDEIKGLNSYGIVENPMTFQSCNFLNIRHYFIHINGKKYAVQNFIIRDCVVELYQDTEVINFNSNNSFVKDLEISNSTFYSHLESNARFMRYAGGRADQAASLKDGVKWSSCSMKFISNTFYKVSYTGQSFNSNSWNRSENSVQLSKNIFFDSCNGEFNRRIVMGNNTKKTCDNNCYWYNGAFPTANEIDRNDGDKSSTAFGVDPEFTNPAEGNFTPANSEVRTHGSGDSRWLK